MENLTARQQQVFNLIKNYIEDTGYPPTRAEIAEELGFRSANAAEEHIKVLAKKGAIERIPGASRGIRIIENQPQGVPIVGNVAAGNPILAEENIEEYCNVSSNLFHPNADYFLRVRGQSMKDIGIMDGDLLAVHKTEVANNNDIVVARIENDVTVKRFKKTRSKHIIHLHAENPAFDVIKVDLRETDFAIEGLSVGVIRL